MMSTLVAQAFWLAMPVIGGGALHVAVIKLGLWPRLARLPLDGGLTLRGRRLLGRNKTVRGAVVMITTTILCATAQAALMSHNAWARDLALNDFQQTRPLLWGALLGVGYIAGELPNSLAKRRLDIDPGAPAMGQLGALFWFADQLDSMIGVLVFMCVVWVPPASIVALLVAITLLVHPATALVMFALGLKSRIG